MSQRIGTFVVRWYYAGGLCSLRGRECHKNSMEEEIRAHVQPWNRRVFIIG